MAQACQATNFGGVQHFETFVLWPCRASPALFLFRNHGFSLSGGLPATGRGGERRPRRPQMMQAGLNSGRTAYRSSPEALPDPFSEGEGSAGPILSESEGAGEV